MIKFAVIGTNFITKRFLEAASSIGEFKLTAVYSRSITKAKEFADEYGAELVFDSLEDLALCKEVDAVYIASPNSFHFQQSMLMLNHKKHVLCEKPITSNSAELELMLTAAKENQVVLLEAMRPAYDPAIYLVQDNLYKLGTIRRAFFTYCQYSSRYDKFKKGIIENAFDPKFSNGAIMDIGVYVIHIMAKLFGNPDSITASGITIAPNLNGAGTIVASYKNMEANLTFSKITDSKLPSEIQGENGVMLIEDAPNPKKITIIYRDGKIEEIPIKKQDNTMYYELEYFIGLIHLDEDVISYNQHSTIQMKIMDEARNQMGITFLADKLSQM